MSLHAKASSAGPTTRQATGLGRFFRGAFATPGASSGSNGSGAPTADSSFAPGGIRVIVLLAALLATALLALALAASSAHAAKGWAFKETFGASNQPSFGNAQQLALDDNGRLYVYDHSNKTVSRWNPDGTAANFADLGSTNVIDGAGGADATPDGSIGGGSARGQIAVDNSVAGINDGRIYVASEDRGVVEVFSEDGTYIDRLTESDEDGEFTFIRGLAVDGSGTVFVSDAGDASKRKVYKFEVTAGPPLNLENTGGFSIGSDPRNLAAGAGPTAGHFFHLPPANVVEKRDSQTGVTKYTFADFNRTRVAVDSATGAVFVNALPGSSVVEYDASDTGAATEVSRLQDAGGAVNAIAVADSAETLYIARSGTSKIEVWEAVVAQEAETGPPSFVSGAKATVTGTIQPFGTTLTECFFEYGRTTSYGQTVPCNPEAASIPADNGTHQVSGELTGLLANGTTYHYRLVTNGAAFVPGQDRTLITADTYSTDPATAVSETTATLRGTVKLEGVPLTDCRLEYGTAFFSSSAPCNPAFGSIPPDDLDHPVSAAVAGLDPAATYRFRLVAENALGQIVGEELFFTTKGKPVVEQQPVDVTQTSATLQARINPAGSDTSYHFEWGDHGEFEEGNYGHRLPPNVEGEAGEGTVPVTRKGFVSDLQPASVYHFRVVATNAFGTTEGPDQPFETLGSNGLPEDRAIELVSPADKGPAGSVAGGVAPQLSRQASEDGNSFLYPIQNGIPESTVGGWTRWRATRTDNGWLSAQISAPSLVAPTREAFTYPSRVFYASEDLGCALLQSYNPLTPDTPPTGVELGVQNLYRWNAVDGSYTLISDRLPLNPELFLASLIYFDQIEASADCSRIFFRSAYELISGASGLYEWDDGTLRDAGVLPDESPGAKAVIGGETAASATSRENAVSFDGGRFLFTAISNDGDDSNERAVFMRTVEDSESTVTNISQSQGPEAANGARFEAASDDGSTVFFAANYGLAPVGGSEGPADGECDTVNFSPAPPIEEEPCDLYAYNAETGELAALSTATGVGSPLGAAVQGVVGLSEDGSHVYFAALGQLTEGEGRTYAQNTSGEGSANIYLAANGGLSYVTTLGRRDLKGRIGSNASALARMRLGWSAETSADGKRLVFESSDNLTSRNTGGGKAVYLYDAKTDSLSCISCRPDGQPTQATEHTRLLAASRAEATTYSPRAMSGDGSRIFFTSPDVLAPGAEPGEESTKAGVPFEKLNVYQWHEGQVTFLSVVERSGGGGIGAYLDASADGSTVFVATKEQLTANDKDFVADVYAIRVGGGFPLTPDAPDCQVNDTVPLEPNQIYCQPVSSPQPGQESPSTQGFAGKGNVKGKGIGHCGKRARQAQTLSGRAKALRRRAVKASRAGNRKAARRNVNRARHAAKAARRNSQAAKRCRRRARAANFDRGGAQ